MARADMTITERLDTYIQIHLEPPLVSFLCSSLSVIDYGSTKLYRIHAFKNQAEEYVCTCVCV